MMNMPTHRGRGLDSGKESNGPALTNTKHLLQDCVMSVIS